MSNKDEIPTIFVHAPNCKSNITQILRKELRQIIIFRCSQIGVDQSKTFTETITEYSNLQLHPRFGPAITDGFPSYFTLAPSMSRANIANRLH
jgi:hypothetical protein